MQKSLFDHLNDNPVIPEALDSNAVPLVRVAFDNSGDNLYDYAIPPHLAGKCSIGQRVKAPFGRTSKLCTGFCVEFPPIADIHKVKQIYEIVDETPLLNPIMMELARWIAGYYCYPLGSVLSAMLPAAVKKDIGREKKTCLRLTEQGRQFSQENLASVRLSSKGRQILEYIHTHFSDRLTDPLDYQLVAVEAGATRGSLLTLQRAGMLELFQLNEIPRPPHTIILPDSAPALPFELNPDQQNAIRTIIEHIDQQRFSTILLYGVTGSGKTEVYMNCIEHVVKMGRQALVLVPEIALTPQTESRFLQRFERVAVLHSGLTNTIRHQQWRWIAEGSVQVVVGARSAVFSPLSNPGIIVVDEEHEPSYKQDNAPRYHGRDVAIKRAQLHNIPVVLGSATPSLETTLNSRRRGHYTTVRLPDRVKGLPLPKVVKINMREELRQRPGKHLLSLTLENQLRLCVQKGQQAILFLNRRGHSNFIYCPSCQYIHTCPNCDVSLTYHKQMAEFEQSVHSTMVCHYCLHSCRVPKVCPVCKGKLILIGPGTQKAEEEIREKFPDIALRRIDSDSVGPGEIGQVLADFAANKISVMLGTQMIAKGLDFPNVTLVGVLNADMALSLPDFRSAERTFQLIAQVAGRCGRAADNGIVIVQSFMPDEPAIAMACRHDYFSFVELELKLREKCQMPPFYRLARVIMRDAKLEKLKEEAQITRQKLDAALQRLCLPIDIRGPVPATIARLESCYRYEILLKSQSPSDLQTLLNTVRPGLLMNSRVQTVVDVDPINLI